MTTQYLDLSIGERLNTLMDQGLCIENKEVAEHWLRRIGQQRLEQYWRTFYDESVTGMQIFRPGVSLDQVLDIYFLDLDLRKALVFPLEAIELHLRSSLTDAVQSYGGSFATYSQGFLSSSKGKPVMKGIQKSIVKNRRSSGPQVDFERKFHPEMDELNASQKAIYAESSIQYPIGVIVESISFVDLSILFEAISSDLIQSKIAGHFSGFEEKELIRFIQSAATLRNSVAHHERIWDRPLESKFPLPKFMKDDFEKAGMGKNHSLDSIFDMLTVLFTIVPNLEAEDLWSYGVKKLIYNSSDKVRRAMGFPAKWTLLSQWSE